MYSSEPFTTKELGQPIEQTPELYIINPHSHLEINTNTKRGSVRIVTYNSTEPITLVAASNPSLVYFGIPQFEEIEETLNESRETYALNNGDRPAFLLVSKTDYPIRTMWPWWWIFGFLFVIAATVILVTLGAVDR